MIMHTIPLFFGRALRSLPALAFLLLLTGGFNVLQSPGQTRDPLKVEARSVDNNRNQPVVLRYADTLELQTRSTGEFRITSGRVSFTQGNVVVLCDRAVQDIARNRVNLYGNVRFQQGSVTMMTPRALYDGNTRDLRGYDSVMLVDRQTVLLARNGVYNSGTRKARFVDDVMVENDSMLIITDVLEYERDSQNSYAVGNVLAVAKHNGSKLWGDTLTNVPLQHYTVARGNPLLCRVDTLRAGTDSTVTTLDSICIKANVLEAFREAGLDRYVATDSVELTRDELSARAGRLVFERQNELIRLYDAPIIWMDSTQLTGDSILVLIPDQQLRRIEADGAAFAATRGEADFTERYDQLAGNHIDILVSADTLRGILAGDEAFSITFRYEDGYAEGAIRNAADSIRIWFEGGQAERAVAIREVDASFVPEFIVAPALAEYKLLDFKWVDERPAIAPRAENSLATPYQRLPESFKAEHGIVSPVLQFQEFPAADTSAFTPGDKQEKAAGDESK